MDSGSWHVDGIRLATSGFLITPLVKNADYLTFRANWGGRHAMAIHPLKF